MHRRRWIGIAFFLLFLAGPLGLEELWHDAYHQNSGSAEDCPLCVAAKSLTVHAVPPTPSLGIDLDSCTTPLPVSAPRAAEVPLARRGRSPPFSS